MLPLVLSLIAHHSLLPYSHSWWISTLASACLIQHGLISQFNSQSPILLHNVFKFLRVGSLHCSSFPYIICHSLCYSITTKGRQEGRKATSLPRSLRQNESWNPVLDPLIYQLRSIRRDLPGSTRNLLLATHF